MAVSRKTLRLFYIWHARFDRRKHALSDLHQACRSLKKKNNAGMSVLGGRFGRSDRRNRRLRTRRAGRRRAFCGGARGARRCGFGYRRLRRLRCLNFGFDAVGGAFASLTNLFLSNSHGELLAEQVKSRC